MKFLILILLLILTLNALPGYSEVDPLRKHVISGKITDKTDGESLAGATVYITELKTGTVTDTYGRFSITLPGGRYRLSVSYIGYAKETREINLDQDIRLKLELAPEQRELQEVVVRSVKGDQNVVKPEMSVFRMDIKTIQKIPALMGEVDVIKAIQLLPGVQSVSEGSSGYSVRGGAPDQNLILLDEATVYNASHLMGFFSVFNNDAVKDVKLFKGDIPANYGGRLSSVLDVRMEEGNAKGFEVNGGIGIIASRLTLEGPLLKDKCSFILSGRRTYADVFLPLSSNQELQNNQLYFYDLNAKVNYIVNDRNQVFLSGYFGRDVFSSQFANMRWGNGTGTLRWNHVFTKKLFFNLTALYSDYQYLLGMPNGTVNSFEWRANLRDVGMKGDLSWYLNPKNTLRFGGNVTCHMISPGTASGIGAEISSPGVKVPENYSLESGIYAVNEQKIGSHFIAKYGLRLSLFQNIGPGTVYHYSPGHITIDSTYYKSGSVYNTFAGLEPRIGLLYEFDRKSSVKVSYARTFQYLQLAQNSSAGTPLDIWFPASPNIRPQISDQVALGYFRNFRRNTIETSVEVYYKSMQHVIDFRNFAQLLLVDTLEGQVRTGSGYAYGIEFLARLNEKIVSGWVSYTYSRSFREIPEIEADPYPAPYDKPHNVSVVVNVQVAKRWSLSANWVYSTGAPVTLPTGRATVSGKVIPIYSDRNAYRYPDYHRLDMSVTFSSKPKPQRKFSWDLNFSVYNVYNRHNTWSINFVQDKADPNITYAQKTYLFGIIPSVTFNFHFRQYE
ncbi:MAG: TonB-dependent receptor [Alphaproteobacteria bacterium]|nr:TonB-dependent receptor [Alphaproteobacteria bacterium]